MTKNVTKGSRIGDKNGKNDKICQHSVVDGKCINCGRELSEFQDWKEYPDSTPIEIPMDLRRPETVDEKIAKILASQAVEKAIYYGAESPEEAEDLDIPEDKFEDDHIFSPHEVLPMQDEFPVADAPVAPEGEQGPGDGPQGVDSPKNGESDVAASNMPAESDINSGGSVK